MIKPRFKSEKNTEYTLLIGKIVTMMFTTILTFPFILYLGEMQLTQETWLLYIGGMAAGVLSGEIKTT